MSVGTAVELKIACLHLTVSRLASPMRNPVISGERNKKKLQARRQQNRCAPGAAAYREQAALGHQNKTCPLNVGHNHRCGRTVISRVPHGQCSSRKRRNHMNPDLSWANNRFEIYLQSKPLPSRSLLLHLCIRSRPLSVALLHSDSRLSRLFEKSLANKLSAKTKGKNVLKILEKSKLLLLY